MHGGLAGAATLLRVFLVVIVGFAVTAQAQPPSHHSEQPSPLLPLSARVIMGANLGDGRLLPEKVNWNGEEYGVPEGVSVLAANISAPRTTSGQRVLGFRALGQLGPSLHGNPCIDSLVALYPKLETADERASLLVLFGKFDDPRALPTAYDVVAHGNDAHIRLLAANVLAQWNIRRGVSVLVEFFPNETKEAARSLGVDALMLFDVLNKSKGWGCPAPVVGTAEQMPVERSYSETVLLAEDAFRKWFQENEHRFPDWKPGDPLPEVAQEGETPDVTAPSPAVPKDAPPRK